jgi:hypothetical protein
LPTRAGDLDALAPLATNAEVAARLFLAPSSTPQDPPIGWDRKAEI